MEHSQLALGGASGGILFLKHRGHRGHRDSVIQWFSGSVMAEAITACKASSVSLA